MAPAAPRRGPRRVNYMTLQRGSVVNEKLINSTIIPRNIEPCTENGYIRQLENWDDFVNFSRAEQCRERSVDNLEDLKEYMYRIGLAMKAGRATGEKLPHGGIKSYWKRFTAAYRRTRGSIRDDFVSSVSELIKPNGAIGRELDVVPDGGPRNHATERHFMWLGQFLWSQDWKVYKSPRRRVELWALLCSFIYTTARVSDYIESSARLGTGVGERYHDTQLLLFTNEEGNSELSLEFKKYLKGRDRRSNKLTKTNIHEGLSSGYPLFLNPMLFLLAMFCANGALRDYRGYDGILRLLDTQTPQCEKGVERGGNIIQWSANVKDKALFPGSDGKILKARNFHKTFHELQIRAGFPDPPGLQSYRAEGLHNIDMSKLYSDTQRQIQGGHDNSRIHGQYYAARNAGVDSQSAYLRSQPRAINIADLFRDFEVRWIPNLWQSLPLGSKELLQKTEEYRSSVLPDILMESKVEDTKIRDDAVTSENETLDMKPMHQADLKRKSRDIQKRLESKELKKVWEDGSESLEPAIKRSGFICRGVDLPFSRIRSVLPERDRLADLLLKHSPLRSADGREALRLLVDLCTSLTEVKQRPGLEPCLCSCNNSTTMAPVHIYKCRKKRLQASEFCFECNTWFYSTEEWEAHCRERIEMEELPVELGWGKINGMPIPGYCIFCLWDVNLLPSRRLQSFLDKQVWTDHVASHHLTGQCPDPRCSREDDNVEDHVRHLHDIHRIPKPLLDASCRKRKFLDEHACTETRKAVCLNNMIFEEFQGQETTTSQ